MLIVVRIPGIAFLCATSVCANAVAQSPTLIDPGWEDPYFADYVSREMREPTITPASPDVVLFSLPVLGFNTIGAPGIRPALAVDESLSQRLRSAIPEWPNCAADSPNVTTVPSAPDQSAGAELGSWFASTYDFGCVQVVVKGDRNQPDEVFPAVSLGAQESGTIEIVYQDENAGQSIDAAGEVQHPLLGNVIEPTEAYVGYWRGNLTYDIVVSCQVESVEICDSSGALTALVKELEPVAGQPSN